MSGAPYDMLAYFGVDDDSLNIVEVAGDDREWIAVTPFAPDATLLVVLYQRGVRRVAVRSADRVAEFDLKAVILRDGSPIGVDR
jgi:hypothetical protein